MSRDELEPEAVARIAKRVRERGPGIVRRARFVHRARPYAVATVAVMAAVLVFLIARREPALELEPKQGEVARVVRPAPPIVDGRACASWSAVEAGQSGRFDLGPRGVAIAIGGSEVRIESTAPCATQLAILRGRVVVHARELGGGELRIRGGDEVVIARGTLFAVEREGSGVAVEVAEGRVELISREIETIRIDAGERVFRERGSIARAPMTEASKEALAIAVGLVAERREPPRRRVRKPKRVERVERGEPPPRVDETPEALLLQGHEARKRGELDRARPLFERAGREIESAWMSLARMELDSSHADAALAALDERERRYGEGALAIEAAWLRVRALDARHDRVRAVAEARKIVERWPSSPYADSARRWLESNR